MAGIDKTYVNKEQWLRARAFADETRDQQIKELGSPISFYYDNVDDISNDSVLWNTSTIQDVWLRKNCRLDFIQDRLSNQYDRSSYLDILAELCTFEYVGLQIHSIESPSGNIYFWYDEGEDRWLLDETDTVLVYGTTYIYELLDKAITSIRGYASFIGTIIFDYYGAELKYVGGKILTDDNTEICLGYISKDAIKLPKLKHSFNSKDAAKFRKELIYFSDDKEVCCLYEYVYPESINPRSLSIPKSIKAGRFAIPAYILKFIK